MRRPRTDLIVPLVKAACVGTIGVFAFAPFGYWPVQWLSLAYLFYRVGLSPTPRSAALIGWAFGTGAAFASIHWLYIAMNRFGDMPGVLALLALSLFSAFLGLYAAFACGVAAWLRRRWALPLTSFALLAMPAMWALSEWLRGWFFTGFPWAVSGYAHNDSVLAGFAPILGVYGVGALGAVCAGALVLLTQRARVLALTLLLVLPGAGLALARINWTHAVGHPITVRLLQGNIAQQEKFSSAHTDAALAMVQGLIMAAPADLIATSETVVALFPQQLPTGYLSSLSDFVRRSGSHLLLGIPLADGPGEYSNSAMGMSPQMVPLYRYNKQHLVPFGEFIPLGFRWFVDLMRMPLGDFTPGAALQSPFPVKDQMVLPNVCYEDLFGEEIAEQLRDAPIPATLLLNMSNLAWYGDSIAIAQHLQISRMRARETGRPMLRATNTGATAIIDAHGRIAAELQPATRATLSATVQGMAGSTPYIRFGNLPFLALLAMALLAAATLHRKRGKIAPKVPKLPQAATKPE